MVELELGDCMHCSLMYGQGLLTSCVINVFVWALPPVNFGLTF